jgi:hypothetical protein
MLTFDPKDAVARGSMQFLDMHDMPDAVRLCIESWKVRTDGSFEVKFVKRLDVLEMFFRLFGDIDSSPAAGGARATVHFHGRGE